MKKFISSLLISSLLPLCAFAQDENSIIDVTAINQEIRKSKSAEQRSNVSKIRRNFEFSTIGDEYTALKNLLQKDYGIDLKVEQEFVE